MASFTEINITSTDIDQSRFSKENHNSLKSKFPHLDDNTIARYLIARNDNLDLSTELLTKAQKWKSLHYPILKQDCLEELSKGTFLFP
jgi:hypothetical protein